MNINDHPFMDYRRSTVANREIFLLKFPHVLMDFLKTDDYCSAISRAVAERRLRTGKTVVSFVPFACLLQRQMRNAFEAFASAHSYQGWVLLRPALEAALIMAKWTDDGRFAEIWKRRDSDRKSYQNEYTGKALVSKSLPEAATIRAVLSRINDDFMHLNPAYYSRHFRVTADDPESVTFSIGYFDDDIAQSFHLHAFMHLCLVVTRSVALMLDGRFAEGIGMKVDVEGFQQAYSRTVQELAAKDPERIPVLLELGLWPNSQLQAMRCPPA